MKFTEIDDLYGDNFNVFNEIGKKWLLITVYDSENKRFNAMTASWGCAGVLWNKPVCVLFVRPQRHTFKLMNENDCFTANILDEKSRQAYKICGSESGADTDKIKKCGLVPVELGSGIAFESSDRVLCLKKLYVGNLEESNFVDPGLLKNYENGDYHSVFVCEITDMYKKAEN